MIHRVAANQPSRSVMAKRAIGPVGSMTMNGARMTGKFSPSFRLCYFLVFTVV